MTPTSNVRPRPRQRGQAMVELGIVLILLVSLAFGIVEFGRLLMIVNMITSATRDGARIASTVGSANRCASNGNINTTRQSEIETIIKNQLADVGLDPGDVTVDFTQGTSNGVPTMTVNTVANVPLVTFFFYGGNTFAVDRSVTFRNETTQGTDGGC